MLGVSAGRRPIAVWRIPEGFPEKLTGAWPAILEAVGDPGRVTRDLFLKTLYDAIPGLSDAELDYAKQVALVVLQQARGSNVFLADLDYLLASLVEGRVHPAQLDAARPSLEASMFSTGTLSRGTKTLDLMKTTGVNWKVPKGFLKKYNAASDQVLRTAASLAGADLDGGRHVVAGVWGSVDVPTFLEACRRVLGELSAEEEDYITSIAQEQVPAGASNIRDLPYLDKCLQQGRTLTSIKGPELLPTIFLNDTTSGRLDGPSLRHTGGRIH
ncbi:hypothetical protein HYH03_014218 [Edaphochlamys debaryana]|uniref:Uncharacterized protein n=1 Tax=Edaphochlamys debaryana TaxID=47281 RepID=A0A836BSC6_9CHLO|nr:hypothetical protein HYH03_014218 [Edaphochlamys debaryana]|eukprot:KAG2487105.1 hypothetical protein HYH03_014218 [Edaphochlamys debaryana]